MELGIKLIGWGRPKEAGINIHIQEGSRVQAIAQAMAWLAKELPRAEELDREDRDQKETQK